ncbi:YusW family protein [Virgibacillus halodenitrificans]|uniref:YusW family protein n=1 Tax=Virgibacillus halodenitrificans TaxID=1482 RepID=UPI00045D477C|nr:YusW family protein [Virgibacillus halodenitrificans]CDQ31076.1 hypothetical protein BN993_00445 [Virgibacillus halodenitrificans]
MKRFLKISVLFITALFITACGQTENENADKNNNTAESEEQSNQTEEMENEENQDTEGDSNEQQSSIDADKEDINKKLEDIDYNEFELEVNYPNNKEYEAEIEYDNKQLTANLNNEFEDNNLNGKAAFDQLYPNVTKLTINKDTNKEQAVKEILDTFDLDKEYLDFEVQLTLKDGTTIEYEDEKTSS